jgi:hypothetical protein
MRLKRRPRFLSGTKLTVNVVCLLVDAPRDRQWCKKTGISLETAGPDSAVLRPRSILTYYPIRSCLIYDRPLNRKRT